MYIQRANKPVYHVVKSQATNSEALQKNWPNRHFSNWKRQIKYLKLINFLLFFISNWLFYHNTNLSGQKKFLFMLFVHKRGVYGCYVVITRLPLKIHRFYALKSMTALHSKRYLPKIKYLTSFTANFMFLKKCIAIYLCNINKRNAQYMHNKCIILWFFFILITSKV